MNQALLNMLSTLESQSVFLEQIAADVLGLQHVVSSLGYAALLQQQTAIARDKMRKVTESHRQEFEKLRQLISQLPSGQAPKLN